VTVSSAPLVGIGLPTRNGEPFLAEALESLLAQDYESFELVIADNASTDRTPEIAREFARRDPRIRYERSDTELSGAANFNRALALSRGPYFMWAADDDRWEPSYVRRCAAALDEDPAAVMACSGLRFIDPSGAFLDEAYAVYDNPDLSSTSVVERVRRLLRRGGWYQSYGLARRDALARTHGMQDVYGPDVVLVLELALLGPILLVPETLFSYRRYPDRTEADRTSRQGGIRNAAAAAATPATHLEEGLSATIRRSGLGPAMRARLLVETFRAVYVDDTILHSRARREVGRRAAAARAERDATAFLKYSLIGGLDRLHRPRRRGKPGRRA
jgi:glycosyltransferase involved in cell wall biosynthesis